MITVGEVNGKFLPLAGGTMSGDIDMDDNEITEVNKLTLSNDRQIEVIMGKW